MFVCGNLSNVKNNNRNKDNMKTFYNVLLELPYKWLIVVVMVDEQVMRESSIAILIRYVVL